MKHRNTLAADRRGAILLVAVFMAAFLVGCLWYLIGVGNAGVYRHRLQDGADAAAFVSAVYHARGMNLIAIMNLVMAAILAVVIALKVLLLITIGVQIVTAAICAIEPFGFWACPIEAFASGLRTTLEVRILPRAQQVSGRLLLGLHKAQGHVARMAPWVGAVMGVKHAGNYGPEVDGGVALSISMIPDLVGAKLDEAVYGGKGDGKGVLDDKRIGLPVQDMDYEELCGKSAKLAVSFIPLPKPFKKVVGKAAETIAGTFSDFFCGPPKFTPGGAKKPAKPEASGASSSLDVASTCADTKKDYDKAMEDFTQQKAAAEANGTAPPSPPEKFDEKKCEKDLKDKLKTGESSPAGAIANEKPPSQDIKAKTMYYRASNGDDYFAVYGLAFGDPDKLKERSDKGVRIATWHAEAGGDEKLIDEVESFGSRLAFAQADFYYDQTAADGGLGWMDYKGEALWHLRWRARLRRFRFFTPDIAAGFVENGLTKIPVPPKYKDKLAKLGGLGMLKDKIANLPKINQYISNKYIGGLVKSKILTEPYKAGNDVDSMIDRYLGGATDEYIIH